MPLVSYNVLNADGEWVCEYEQIFKRVVDAPEKLELQSDEGETYYAEKVLVPVIAKTPGLWKSVPTWEPGLGAYVNNSKHRDQIAQAKGLVARDDVSSSKHLVNDMLEKKKQQNAYWDKRHEEYQTLLDAEIKKGFSKERAEHNASLEWGREDKLNEDKKHYNDKVANMKVPTNLNIK